MPGNGDYRVDNLGRGRAASISWDDVFGGKSIASPTSLEMNIIVGGKKVPKTDEIVEAPIPSAIPCPPSPLCFFRDKRYLRVGDCLYLYAKFSTSSIPERSDAEVVQITKKFVRIVCDKLWSICIDRLNYINFSFTFRNYNLLSTDNLDDHRRSLEIRNFYNTENCSRQKKLSKKVQMRSNYKQRRTAKQQGKTARLFKESFLETI